MRIYKRKASPLWYYTISINGNRVRRSTGTTDQKLAEAFVARKQVELYEEAHLGKKQKRTLDVVFGKYLLEHVSHLKSLETVSYQCEKLLNGLGSNTSLSDVTTESLSRYIAKRRQEVSNASVNREIAAFRKLYNLARDVWGYQVAPISFRQLKLTEPKSRVRWEDHATVNRIIDCAAPHLRPIILTALYTGARLSNILNLKWADVRTESVIFREVKNVAKGKTHEVPLVKPLRIELEALRNATGEKAEYVFTYKGKPLKRIKTAWWNAVDKAGVSDFRFHDLRHTCASWLIQDGVPIEIVKEILGHADISTTLKYAHHQPSQRGKEMERVLAQFRHKPKLKAVKGGKTKGL